MLEKFRHYQRIKNRVGDGLCVKQDGQLDFSASSLKSLSMKENASVILVPFRQYVHPLGIKSVCEKSLCGLRTTFTDIKYI